MTVPDSDDAPVTITQFTDPMCTWCWGSEPVVRRLRTAYGDGVRVEYVMGGLVEDFETFYDPANDISTPAEVAPHWVEASEQHGMPVDVAIFEENPAQSTYPASEAFAAARLQDERLANRYLRLLREAYVTQVRNVNERGVQVDLAERVGLDVAAFTDALDDGSARAAFENDLARTREAGVRAFPTYHVTGPAGERRLDGFQSFQALSGAVDAVAPDVDRSPPPSVASFVAEYGPAATREVAEVCALAPGKAKQVLTSLEAEGAVEREQRGNGLFWRAPGGESHG